MIVALSSKTAQRDVLNAALLRAPSHLRPVYFAVRDEGCVHAMIGQDPAPFSLDALPPGPVIAIIGDDMHRSVGPDGFHRPSVDKLLSRCVGAAIIVAMDDKPYLMAATTAVLERQDVVIIETRAEHEMHWVDACRRVRPNMGLVLCQDREQVADA